MYLYSTCTCTVLVNCDYCIITVLSTRTCIVYSTRGQVYLLNVNTSTHVSTSCLFSLLHRCGTSVLVRYTGTYVLYLLVRSTVYEYGTVRVPVYTGRICNL